LLLRTVRQRHGKARHRQFCRRDDNDVMGSGHVAGTSGTGRLCVSAGHWSARLDALKAAIVG